MLQILVVISQKVCYRKEAWGYAKVIHKKKKEKRKKELRKKMDKCLRYLKQWDSDACLKKDE